MMQADLCDHGVAALVNCQRCGRVHCAGCRPRGVKLKALGSTLPVHACGACRAALDALDAAATAPGEDEQARRAAALAVLDGQTWVGEGEDRLHAGRAAVAAALVVPAAAISAVTGALQGLAKGALGGAVSGAVGLGLLAFDGGNKLSRLAGGKDKEKKALKDKEGHSGKEGAEEKGKEKEKEGEPKSRRGSAVAKEGEGAAATPAAGGTPPAEGVDVMARAKATLRLSAEEKAAEAEKEAARMTAAADAYAVLMVPRDAAPEAIGKAHKAWSMAYHPDKNASPKAIDVMQAVNAAYALLSDPDRRAAYDAAGCTSEAAEEAHGPAAAGPKVDIKASAAGKAASGVAGVLGFAAGGALGAVTGLLGGMVTSVVSTGMAAKQVATQTLPAQACVDVRVAAARAVLADAGAAGSLTVALDGPTGKLSVSAPPALLRAVLGPAAPRLAAPVPTRVVDVPSLEDCSFAPSAKFLDRLVRCAGEDEEDRAYTLRLALALAAYAKAQRRALGVPEPALEDDGDGEEGAGKAGSDATHSDATGVHGGDTYEEAQARLAEQRGGDKTIKTARSMAGHMMKEAMESLKADAAKMHALQLLQLGAVWEALSRGKRPTEEWVIRRIAGLRGGGEGEDSAVGKAVEGEAALKPLTDPDHGWGPAGADAEGAAPVAAEAVPACFVEVAVVGPGGKPPSSSGKGGAAAAGGVKGDDGLLYYRLGRLAAPGVEGEPGSAAFDRLPGELLVHVQGGKAGAGGAKAHSLRVRLVVQRAGGQPHNAVAVAAADVTPDWEVLAAALASPRSA